MAQLGDYLQANEAHRLRAAVSSALLARAGIGDYARDGEYAGMSMSALAAESVERAGLSTIGRTAAEIAGLAMAHSTSDFPRLLLNTMYVAALKGFDETQEVYPRWTSRGSLPDFRDARRVGLGAYPI